MQGPPDGGQSRLGSGEGSLQLTTAFGAVCGGTAAVVPALGAASALALGGRGGGAPPQAALHAHTVAPVAASPHPARVRVAIAIAIAFTAVVTAATTASTAVATYALSSAISSASASTAFAHRSSPSSVPAQPAASVLAMPQGGVPASVSYFSEPRSGRVTVTCPGADDVCVG